MEQLTRIPVLRVLALPPQGELLPDAFYLVKTGSTFAFYMTTSAPNIQAVLQATGIDPAQLDAAIASALADYESLPSGGTEGQVLRVGADGTWGVGDVGGGGGTALFNANGIISLTDVALWLRAEDLALTNGAAVASWTDLSGNGRHAVQATASQRPTYVASSLGGRPAVSFDGIDDALATPAFAYGSAQVTVMVVTQTNTSSVYRFVFETGLNYGSGPGLNLYRPNAGAYEAGLNYASTPVAIRAPGVNTFPALLVIELDARREGGAMTVTANGMRSAGVGRPASPSTQLPALPHHIGSRAGSDGFYLGVVSELMIIRRLLTLAEMDQMQSYAFARYGI